MKVRITLMTENMHPASVLGENPEAEIRKAWNLLISMMCKGSREGDKAHIESVEIVDRGGAYKPESGGGGE